MAARPEPWASYVDLITASQALEDAIHATSGASVWRACLRCREQLLHARDYLVSAQQYVLADEVFDAANQVVRLGSRAVDMSPLALRDYQEQVLYGFQATLSDLAAKIRRLGGGF